MAGAPSDLFQVVPHPLGEVRLPQGDAVKTDNGVHGGADLMAHVGKEEGFGPVCLVGGIQCLAEGLLLGHGLTHLGVDHREAEPDGMDPVVRPFGRMPHAGHPDHLVILPSGSSGEVAIGQDLLLFQSPADRLRIDKAQEAFPVILVDGILRIPGKALQVWEVHSFRRMFVVLRISAIADRVVLFQIDMVDRPIVRGQCRDHAVLLSAELFLLQKLFLQRKSLLQLLLLDTAGRLGTLPFHFNERVFAGLGEDVHRNPQQRQDGQGSLNHASENDFRGNGTDPLADQALPDQVGQQPVGAAHRDVSQRLRNTLVGKGNDPFCAFFEIVLHLFHGIGMPVLKDRMGQRFQKVILHREAAQHGIAQCNAVAGIDVAEGGAALLGLHGYAREHFLHGDLHKAGLQCLSLVRKLGGHDNNHLFLGAVQVRQVDFRSGQIKEIKRIFPDVVLCADGSIDEAVGIHKGKLLQVEELLHTGLISL